jgi:AraC-like DNA-binding protein/mannose-6-phosphate isomerase-like protein (cupin superfamily)
MDELTVLPDQSEILHYDDPTFPLYLRRNTLSLYPFKHVLCHWHQEFEFFFVEKGNPSYYVNGTTVKLHEGELIFINSRYPHYGFSADGTDSTYLVLVFQPSLLIDCPLIGEEYVTPLRQNPDLPFLVFSKEKCPLLQEEMRTMFTLLERKEASYALKVLAHLYTFWADFLALKGQEKPRVIAHSHQGLLLEKMLTYIYAHYAENLSVSLIAGAAAISESYAIHLFSALLHASPIAYLTSYRIERSEELLKNPENDISEVARQVGFESPAYFSETFRKEKGYSPREFRRLLLEKHVA